MSGVPPATSPPQAAPVPAVRAGGAGQPSQELAGYARDLFGLYDADGSGSIDANELPNLLRALGFAPSNAECVRLLRTYDQSQDGTLQLDEVLRLLASEAPALRATEPSDADLQNAFWAFDTNGDGTVSLAELRAALSGMGERMSPDEIERILSRVPPGTTEMGFELFKSVFTGQGATSSGTAAGAPSGRAAPPRRAAAPAPRQAF